MNLVWKNEDQGCAEELASVIHHLIGLQKGQEQILFEGLW